MKRIGCIFLLCTMTALFACGGGGGGGGTPAAGPPTKAIAKLSTTGPGGTQIGGVDVTVGLPAGVTVKATAAPPETDPGVVVASGVAAANSITAATYDSANNTVRVVLVNGNANGFGPGEFATITCDLASGTSPAASAFTVSSVTIGDINGAPLAGVTVTVGVTLE